MLACVIDITTALIPEFLLHHLQMRLRTKVILNLIFALGLVTAALSVGRAATSNSHIWTEDATWRIMPSNTFSLVEEKLGIIFASAPALRQLLAYLLRTRTVLPSARRQAPGADFVAMRRRVKLRDMFWYSKPPPGPGAVPMTDHTNKDGRPRYRDREAANSPLDAFGKHVKAVLSFGSSRAGGGGPGSAPRKHGSGARRLRSLDMESGAAATAPAQASDSNRIRGKYEAWGLPPGVDTGTSEDDRSSGPAPSEATFLQTGSSAGAVAEWPKHEAAEVV